MSIADILKGFAETLKSRLNSINAALVNKGQSEAGTYDDVPSKIEAIETGADVSGVTATSGDVLSPKVFVDASGTEKTGTMADNGTVTKTLDTSTTSYTIAAGKHSGSGKVSVVTQTKSATPSTSAQTISADSGKVLKSVSVGAIPASYVQPTYTNGITTWTPTTYDQTIPSGTYCRGVQTIKGDADLVASNIKSGVNIFGVTGSFAGGGGYIGDAVFVSASEMSNTSMTFSVNTTNLIGFKAFCQFCEFISPYQVVVFDVTYMHGFVIEGGLLADGVVEVNVGYSLETITINSSSITIAMSSSRPKAAFNISGWLLYPIYSA